VICDPPFRVIFRRYPGGIAAEPPTNQDPVQLSPTAVALLGPAIPDAPVREQVWFSELIATV
jgi:hypothetical protein